MKKEIIFAALLLLCGSCFMLFAQSPGGAYQSPSTGGGLPLSFNGVPTGTCSALQTAVNVLTGDFYNCIAGAWQKVGPGGNPGVLTSPVVTPNPLALDVDLHFKGPNPWQDITRYGARAIANNVIPAIPGITATINATSTSATVSTSACGGQTGNVCFQNGDGVVIFGAGAAHSMSTPTGLTVTPSLAASGTGTGIVATGPTGATTYNYQIIARNKQGGMTAASAVASTTTGAASLGKQTVNITSISKSGLINTVVTASAHGLSVGAMVFINGTTNDLDFGSWFRVATVPDNTHFTYANGRDSANGAGTSATGGTVIWYNCNHLAWTQVTGAFVYYIYGRTGGSLTLLGVSLPDNNQHFDDTWDDFGSPMMDGFTAPYYVPTTPPGAATSNHLVTTISSGAGTTSLTLALAAGTSVAGATILFDNAPTIKAAITSSGMPTFIPSGSFVTNSYLAVPGAVSMMMSGSLVLNDTIEVAGGVKWYGERVPIGASPGSFAWAAYPTIFTNRSVLGVYLPNPNGNTFTGLTFQADFNNDLLLLLDAGTQFTMDKVNFLSNGSADYMTTGFRGRTDNNNNSLFFNIIRDITMSAGQNGTASATPMFSATYLASTEISNISASGRAFHFGNALGITMVGSHYQGGGTPFIMVGGFTSNAGISAGITLQDIGLDTTPQSLLCNLNGNTLLPTNDGYIFINSGTPSAGMPNISGSVMGNILQISSGIGQNTSTSLMSGAGVSSLGTSTMRTAGTSSVGYSMQQPAAVTVQLGLSGSCSSNCVAAGSVTYQIAAIDILGLESPQSPIITVNPDGTQTVTVSWVPIQGQVSTRFFRNGVSNTGDGAGIANVTSFIDGTNQCNVCGAFYSNSENHSKIGGTSSSVSSFGIASGLLNLSPVLFANLGTPGNGTFVNCSDCTIANPCAGGGTGAFAKRLNGVWVCN
jgi:hypothetical protein